ncbi:unnamed protein product (macronuclear) [Paramecium tetraurelia]|uniref:Uncharacterized protein n=1 Tax=Paramecium tetraurelia TaxID=5888 RepID=A0DL12_PARTE|nr:uncharacterized protein GSPATT00018046001 [Paramecium tetraurelia]CAK83729.1 unnamed protein product [Paramecium tetraurelia]|eukprot:XP_001451126.1 hypothetical protein (macronuclear) [Paramecium tetraurelia strain d4-2]
MNQGDNFFQELIDGFRSFESQSQGDEKGFKNPFNQLQRAKKKISKQLYQKQLYSPQQAYQGSTSNYFSMNRQSFSINEEARNSNTNLTSECYCFNLEKITDCKKHTDSVLDLLRGFNKDNEAAIQEGIQSNKLLQQSKINAIETQEYHQLLKNVQNLKKQSLIDKHSLIQQEIKQIQDEYIEYRQNYQQKYEITQQQRQVIEGLDGKKAKQN